MTRTRFPALALLASALLFECPLASAQQPGSTPPAAVVALPTPPVAPVVIGAPVECCPVCPCEAPKKICVAEPKKNTKVVYGSRCQDYCLPKCGSFLGTLFGKGSCDCCKDGDCGTVRTRHVLVKKKVPDCDTMSCVVKEVACGSAVIVPAAASVPAPGRVLVPLPAPDKLHHGKH